MTETRHKYGLLDALAEHHAPPTATGTVYLDGDAWSEALELKTELGRAKADSDSLKSEAPRLQAELDQVRARLEESKLVFQFRQLSRTESEALTDAHQDGAEEGMPWNADTYPQALIAAACVNVSGVYSADSVTVDEVSGLWDRLGQKQTDDLFRAAWNVQLEAPTPFMFAATEPTTPSGPNSTTATE